MTPKRRILRRLTVFCLISLTMCIGIYLRTRNLDLLDEKLLIGNDPYLFVRYSQHIVEYGELMSHDRFRYAPIGISTRYSLNFVAYVLGFMNSIIGMFLSHSLYETAIWYPVVFFALALLAFYLMVRSVLGQQVAVIASFLLAITPSFLQRTIAGFADKEPLAIFLMVTSMVFYIFAYKSETNTIAAFWGFFSGIFGGLMGLAWRGVVFVILVVVVYNIVLVAFGYLKKKDFSVYLTWCISLVCVLQLGTSRYGDVLAGSASLVLLFPVVTLGVLLFHFTFAHTTLRRYWTRPDSAKHSAFRVFSVFATALVLGGILYQSRDWGFFLTIITNPKANVWSTVLENAQPSISYWWGYFGFLLPLSLLGAVMLVYNRSNFRFGYKYALVICLLTCSVILSKLPESISNDTVDHLLSLFLVSTIASVAGILGFFLARSIYLTVSSNRALPKDVKSCVFIIVWFIVSVIAARMAQRFFFLFTPIALLLAAYAIFEISQRALGRFRTEGILIQRFFPFDSGRRPVLVVLAVVLLGGPPSVLGIARSSGLLASKVGPSFDQQWIDSAMWIDRQTNRDSIIASQWDCGYWIQSMGSRPTLLDEGVSSSRRISFSRNFLCAKNSTEGLRYLREYEVTHLLLSSREVIGYSKFSAYASTTEDSLRSHIGKYDLSSEVLRDGWINRTYTFSGHGKGWMLDQDLQFSGMNIPMGKARIDSFKLKVSQMDKEIFVEQPTALLFSSGRQYEIPIRTLHIDGKEYTFSEGMDGILMIINGRRANNDVSKSSAAFFVSGKAKSTLWVRLLLLGERLDGFEKVYDDEIDWELSGGDVKGPIKIWRVVSQPDIE